MAAASALALALPLAVAVTMSMLMSPAAVATLTQRPLPTPPATSRPPSPLPSLTTGVSRSARVASFPPAPVTPSGAGSPAAAAVTPVPVLVGPVATSPPGSAYPPLPTVLPVPPLRVVGNTVVDARGTIVIFRGVQRNGLEGDSSAKETGLPWTQTETAAIASWGTNIVRIPLSGAMWLPGCPTQYNPVYPVQVDQIVKWVTSLGMVALLDLHYAPVVRCGPQSFAPMAAKNPALDFWAQVAARYKTNPLVAFDLYNEPHDIPSAVWRDGGQVRYGAISYTAAGMQEMYDTVRATGAQNLVFVSGDRWGADPSPILDGHALTGSNIVYATHAYTCPRPDAACESDPSNLDFAFSTGWSTVQAAYPVALTEFGWPNSADPRYDANSIAYAESHGWGWIAFQWNPGGYWSLTQDSTSWAPTPAGQVVSAAIRAP